MGFREAASSPQLPVALKASSMVEVSVCIISLNARDVLQRCLKSIYQDIHDPEFLEVIVVDNNSGDDTPHMLRDEFPVVHLIENATNVGFTRAMNQAIRVCRGRYICWLNSDTIVLSDALFELVRFMNANPNVGVVGPKLLNADGSFQPQCKRGLPTPMALFSYGLGLDNLFPNNQLFSQYLLRFLPEETPHKVTAVSGACLVTRRTVLELVGNIDEEIFAFGEDIDWCLRTLKAGWEVWYNPEAQIVHIGGQGGSASFPVKAVYEYHRSIWLVYRKHLIDRYTWPVHIALALGIGARCVWSLLRNTLRTRKLVGTAKMKGKTDVLLKR